MTLWQAAATEWLRMAGGADTTIGHHPGAPQALTDLMGGRMHVVRAARQNGINPFGLVALRPDRANVASHNMRLTGQNVATTINIGCIFMQIIRH
jgi:hypothetical protein